MPWNWELSRWPEFVYDPTLISEKEKKFLIGAGENAGFIKTIEKEEYHSFVVEILSVEGVESAKIEGEILDRESLQSSIQRQFGLSARIKEKDRESGMAHLLCDVYRSFQKPLTHQMLWDWHRMLFEERSDIEDLGKYRTHEEPMQIVSNRYNSHHVYFEAPPSKRIFKEMGRFIEWFNTKPATGILGKAAIAHVYFESIHPFEDGNGRIGRALIEKILSQSLGRPLLMAFSRILEKKKKEYYAALERCNRTLEVQHWVDFFADIILQSQKESTEWLFFIIEKSKKLSALSGKINQRQEKVLLRMYEEGPSGFKGGLSADKYISITKTSKATATRDLTELVEMGALKKTGTLRHTRYYLNHPHPN